MVQLENFSNIVLILSYLLYYSNYIIFYYIVITIFKKYIKPVFLKEYSSYLQSKKTNHSNLYKEHQLAIEKKYINEKKINVIYEYKKNLTQYIDDKKKFLALENQTYLLKSKDKEILKKKMLLLSIKKKKEDFIIQMIFNTILLEFRSTPDIKFSSHFIFPNKQRDYIK